MDVTAHEGGEGMGQAGADFSASHVLIFQHGNMPQTARGMVGWSEASKVCIAAVTPV